MNRFPVDFMFEMTIDELSIWRSQFVTSKEDMKGLRYAPFCFTEQGLTMLSCVLNSERAITVNIQVIRIFTRMREMLLTHKDLLLKMNELEQRVGRQDDKIQMIFDCLKEFVKEKTDPRKPIGFKQENRN